VHDFFLTFSSKMFCTKLLTEVISHLKVENYTSADNQVFKVFMFCCYALFSGETFLY